MEYTCRLCLKESSEIMEEIWEGCDILNQLTTCLSHYISLSEDLPKRICYLCVKTIQDIYTFYQKISLNEIMLQQKANNAIDDKNLHNIKEESDSDCNDNEITIDGINKIEDSFIKNDNVKSDDIIMKYTSKIEKVETDLHCKILNIPKENIKENDPQPFYGSGDDIPLSILKENKSNNDKSITKLNKSRKFTCLTCFEIFNNQLELLRHYQHIELENFNKNNKELEKQIKPVRYSVFTASDGTMSYKCDRCYKKYKHKTYIERHIISHIDKRPYLCKLCGKTYQTATTIVAHGKMHTGEMHSCSYNCGYKSVHKHVVMDHEKRHRKEYKYKCQTCGKGFQVKTWYQQHQNIHNDIKPYSCDLCGKSFHLQKYLTTHKSNVHPQSSSRKPWVCKQCFMPCDSKNSLNIHLKASHGIIISKPILCDICGKVVRNTQQLKHHKRAVHLKIKPYSCSFCDKSFPKKFSLKVHEQTHMGKRYLCNKCDRMFTRKDTLLRHLKNCHTDSKHKCERCEKTFPSKLKADAHKKDCIQPAEDGR